MAEAYPFELRDDAHDLYVEQGLTYEQVAERLGIAVNTARNWGQQYEWAEARRKFVESRRLLKENLRRLRQKMIEKAIDAESPDPHDIYAVVKLEKLAAESQKKIAEKEPEIDRPRIFLENLEFVASVMKEIDPEGLRILAQSFDEIVSRFKEKFAKAEQSA